MWEHETFSKLPPNRQAPIEVVSSAYDSVVGNLTYLTMPVTAGRRLYELFDKYKVRSKEELERKRPGALWEEVILPNIENGRALAEKLHRASGRTLVVPGIFDAHQLEWSQEEYMVLWLRFITNSAGEICLAPGWEYSTGGAMEFVRSMLIQFRFVLRNKAMAIRNERLEEFSFTDGALNIAYAIEDLRRRGHNDARLQAEFQNLANIALTLQEMAAEDKMRWEYHVWDVPSFSASWILSAAHSLDLKPKNLFKWH